MQKWYIMVMRRRLLIYVLAFILGISVMYTYQEKVANNPLDYYVGQDVSITGKITEIKQKDEKYTFVLETEAGPVLCNYYGKFEDYKSILFEVCDITGTLDVPKSSGNPRTFDYALYLKSKGIRYICIPSAVRFHNTTITYYDKFKRWIFLEREKFIDNLKLSEEVLGPVKGILFGDTGELDEDVYEEFQKNSTAHILAVSGLHIGVLFSLYKALMKKKNNRIFTLVFIIFTLIYGFATLWSVSVTRAIMLMYTMILANVLDRRYDLLTAAALVAGAFALKNPYIIFGASFQMSFLAVCSISFFTPIFERILPASIAGAAAVQFGMLPYMIYSFNGISVAGVLINVPVVYIISILVPAGVTGYFVFMISQSIMPMISFILDALSKLTLSINHLFASCNLLYITLPSMKLGTLLMIYGLMFLCASEYFQVNLKRKKWKHLILALCLVLSISLVGWKVDQTPFDQARIVFLDVGQGDSVHIKTDSGGNILIDGGGNPNYNVGSKILKPYLLKNGYSQVNLALATHLHTDHYLGLRQLSEEFKVSQEIITGKSGDVVNLGKNERIEILWPEKKADSTAGNSADENANSMIFKVTVQGLSVLITGDITIEGEKLLLRKYAGTDVLKADILKVAHHGSAYSSCEEFIDAVNPKVAVISVGKNNYGHPSDDVIEKFREKGIIVFRTDLDGAVGIIKKGDSFSVCTKRNRKNMHSRPLQKI